MHFLGRLVKRAHRNGAESLVIALADAFTRRCDRSRPFAEWQIPTLSWGVLIEVWPISNVTSSVRTNGEIPLLDVGCMLSWHG